MNTRIILTFAFVGLSIAAMGPASAQVQVQPYPQQVQPYPQQVQPYPQQVQPYPQQGQAYPGGPQAYPGCPPRVTPSAQVLDERFMRRFGPLGLQPAQQQRIESIVAGFSQAHPAGSPLEPMAMRQLRDEVRSVLTPQQLAMLEQENRGRPPSPHRCP